jgi:hypothetical protein
MFTAEEAFEDESIVLTRGAALNALRDHMIPADEFFAELGDRPVYPAHEVLGWMGY